MKIFLLSTLFTLLTLDSFSQPTFPDGDASLQTPLKDNTTISCESNTLHVLTANPRFPKVTSSVFTKENTKNIYVLLVQIDSSYLFTEDCDYSLLKFLRLRTTQNNLAYEIKDSVAEIVNKEKLRIIQWANDIPLYLYDRDQNYPTTFSRWAEYWECNEKADYAPVYPFIYPKKTSLVRKQTKEMQESLQFLLTNPIFVFAIIPFDDSNADWLSSLKGKPKNLEMFSNDGKRYNGKSIDLNSDNIPDAFWYLDVKDDKIISWTARLYINIDGSWTPIYHTYFKEM